ncbi:MAG: cytochrome C oxidase subunit IV family protein [Nitrospirae bacterium]|nr:cytochrome C oxidase subunit IV family protein [Nitrospirota bacterium]
MEDARSHITGYKTYAYIWACLLLLTGLTVTVAKINFTGFSVLICLVIASIKALLVLMFFMHVRYEGAFLKGVILLTIFTLTAMIGLTFSDVWYR